MVLWYIKKINQMKKNYQEKEFVAKLRSDLEKHFNVLPSEKVMINALTGKRMKADLICFIREGTPEIAGEFFTVECKKAFGKKVRPISDAFHQASEHVNESDFNGKKALFGLVASPESYSPPILPINPEITQKDKNRVKRWIQVLTQHEALRNIGWLQVEHGELKMMMSKAETGQWLYTECDGFDLEQLAQKQGSKRVRTYRNESV